MSDGVNLKPGEFSFRHGDQRYSLVRIEPYQRQDGSLSRVAILETRCCVCGDHFELIAPLNGARRMTRHCPAHRRRGSAGIATQIKEA